jgi:hypothetical protein
MSELEQIEKRIPRLRQLVQGLGREAARWKSEEGPLEAGELHAYLEALQDAIAGLDRAGAAMESVLERLRTGGACRLGRRAWRSP